MKKISILSLHLGYGGIEKCVCSLANILCKKYDVEIACVYKLNDTSAFDLDKKVKVKYLAPGIKPNKEEFKNALHNKKYVKTVKEGFYSLKVLSKRREKMINYIKSCDSDIVISTRELFNYWLGSYGKDSVVKIGWEHNHFHEDYGYASKVVNSVKRFDYFVLVSKDLRKYYSKQLVNSNCKCLYIPNCIDYIPPKGSSLRTKRFISVGRLSKEKGFLDLLKVYKKFLSIRQDWVLDIVGDGDCYSELEDFIKKNNMEEYVTLHGFLDKKEINKLLKKSSIYLMCSHTESFGIVLIEAMSFNIPCIAFDSAEGAKEIINSGENGYLIKNRNMNAMVKKMNDLANDYSFRVKLGENALKSIKKYSIDNVSKRWFDLIEKSGKNE